MMKIAKLAVGVLLSGCGLSAAVAQAWTEPVTGMPLVAIPKGCFQMGSRQAVELPADTVWGGVGYKGSPSDNEKPQHEVCVDAIWIGRYEVRLTEWWKVMGGEKPAAGHALPVARVTWEQAQAFAQRLSELSGSGHRFRLPTEAEWEYACLAGQAPQQSIDFEAKARVANYGQGSSGPNRFRIASTGLKKANAWGLHDMLGNVWEWVADSYLADGYVRHSLYNPRVDTSGVERVIRGGSFRTEYAQVRCNRRGHQPPAEALDSLGFRLVREK